MVLSCGFLPVFAFFNPFSTFEEKVSLDGRTALMREEQGSDGEEFMVGLVKKESKCAPFPIVKKKGVR